MLKKSKSTVFHPILDFLLHDDLNTIITTVYIATGFDDTALDRAIVADKPRTSHMLTIFTVASC